MEAFWTAGILLLAVVNTVYLLVMLAVLRQVGIMLVRLGPATARIAEAGPAIGSALEPVTLTDTRGNRIQVGPTKHGLTVIAFLSPRCDACRGLIPSLEPFARQYRDLAHVIAVSTVDEPTGHDDAALSAIGTAVPLVRSRSFAEDLKISLTPYAIVVGDDGRIVAKGIANSLEQLESLLKLEEFRPRAVTPFALAAGGEE